MDGSEGVIASAVVVPELTEEETQHDPGSLKRRHSSASEQEAKKPRLSGHDQFQESANTNGNHGESPTQPKEQRSPRDKSETEARRKNALDEEKKRGRRLFGGLLGTLSQQATNTTHRRRVEIEKKQKEKLRAQDEEEEEDKKRQLEQLTEERVQYQSLWDEETVRIQQSNNLAMAGMLRTEAEPHIYYLPFELRPDEQKRIDEQVSQAKAEQTGNFHTPERNHKLADDKHEGQSPVQQARNAEEDVSKESPHSNAKPRSGGSQPATPSHDNTQIEDATKQTNSPQPEVSSATKDKGAEESEDVILEAGEDSVIY